jgi:F-type H+-transporting ATPase subunit delta
MADRTDAYASALFEVARAEGSLERVEEELFRAARTVESDEQLRSTLTDPAIPLERRLGVVQDVFARAHPTTISLVSFIVSAGRARDLAQIADGLVRRAAEERSQVVAEVRSAVPLDDDRRRRLEEALSRRTNRQVSVKVIVDPSVVGGLVAQVGDMVIDGSVRTRLNQLREAI